MHPMEFAGIAPLAPERADFFSRFAQQDMDFVIGTVTDEQVFLPRVRREADVPDRTDKSCIRLETEFSNERTVFAEHLIAVIDTITDVYQAIARKAYAMHGIAELFRNGRTRIVFSGI